MTVHWYFAWFNLIFAVPFLFALLYLVVYAASGITFGDPDTDADADGDTDGPDGEDGHDADDAKSVAVDAVGAPGHHDGTAPSAEAMAGAPVNQRVLRRLGLDQPYYRRCLRWFGVGRVPLSILLMVLFFAWGCIGVTVNLGLRGDPRFAADPWQLSIPVALLGSGLVTRGLSNLFAKWLPSTETYARARASLVGLTGLAVLPIDRDFGLAVVRDERGTAHQVPCRVLPGAVPLEKGQALCLAEYDPNQKVYFVTAAG